MPEEAKFIIGSKFAGKSMLLPPPEPPENETQMASPEVQIEYSPWKKIVIHQMKETSRDALCLIHGPEGFLHWADGVLFTANVMDVDHTEFLASEAANGILHFELIAFCMEEKIPERGVQCRGETIYVINDTDAAWAPLATWLKKQHKEIAKPAVTGILERAQI